MSGCSFESFLNLEFMRLVCWSGRHQLTCSVFSPLSQLTDDVKKEKEKEPEKAEKPETAVFKKKGFEEEKKDSDDSDEV